MDTHLHLAVRLRMDEAIPPLHHTPSMQGQLPYVSTRTSNHLQSVLGIAVKVSGKNLT